MPPERACVIEQPGLRLLEEPLRVYRIRASHKDRGEAAAVAQAWGVTLPATANSFSGDAAFSCAWVEPRAWLVLGGRELALPDATLPLIVDLSDRYAAFRLAGTDAATLLAGGTGLELATLAPGRCAYTLFAEEAIVFLQALRAQDYRLVVEAPLAGFFGDWLRDAAPRVPCTAMDTGVEA